MGIKTHFHLDLDSFIKLINMSLVAPISPLRLLLLASSILLIIFPWLPGATNFSGNEVSPGLLAAVTTPVVWMLLLLDSAMLGVYMEGSNHHDQNAQWRRLIRCNLLLAVLIVASWVPFFVQLND